MATVDIDWTYEGEPLRTSVTVDVPADAAPDAPLVVLLHGTSGNANAMADPAVDPENNYERFEPITVIDRGWRHYPGVGFWDLGIDKRIPVTSWAGFLTERGFPVLNYDQRDNRGRLPRTTAELIAVLSALESQRAGGGATPGLDAVKDREIVLLGHSRGGVLARQALVDLAAASAPVLPRIRTCITLHAPNQGSGLANFVIALPAILEQWRWVIASVTIINPFLAAALFHLLTKLAAHIEAEVIAPAYEDYKVGSTVLADIAAREPVAGVEYFTFGGTRAELFWVRQWSFTPLSAVPMPHSPPFFWQTRYDPIVPMPPPLPFMGPELTPGQGDVLVSADGSRLPFAPHWNNDVNHAEALWDPVLHRQVAAILDGAPLPETFVVTCVAKDSKDAGRAIDAFGGIGPTGVQWRLSLDEAMWFFDRGHVFFVRDARGRLMPLQRVTMRNGTRYFRTLAGSQGHRLTDLPSCQ